MVLLITILTVGTAPSTRVRSDLTLTTRSFDLGAHTHRSLIFLRHSHALIKFRNSWDQTGVFDPLFRPIYRL